MANAALETVVDRLRRATATPNPATTDRDLLKQFSETRDERAFAEVVARHGPAVMGVCRRVLHNTHDAEDAFQATFLVLAKKAGTIAWKESVAYWLYEVACRVSQKARGANMRRQQRQAREFEESVASASGMASQFPQEAPSEAIDEEIRKLPKAYAETILLCGVHHHSTDEAARQLGVTEGSVRARLYRGREMLRERLAARGLAVPVCLTVVVGNNLIQQTARAAVAFASGTPVPGPATSLAEGVLKTMWTTKLSMIAALTVSFGLTVGAGYALMPGNQAQQAPGDPNEEQKIVAPQDSQANAPKPDEKNADKPTAESDPFLAPEADKKVVRGKVKAVDVTRKTLLVECDLDDKHEEITFAITPTTQITVAKERLSLADVKPNMKIDMLLSADKTSIAAAKAHWQGFRSKVLAVDAAKGTVTINFEANGTELEIAFPLKHKEGITIGELHSGLSDLVVGNSYEFHWSADKKSFIAIEGDAPKNELKAIVKSVDAVRSTVSILLDIDDDGKGDGVEIAFDLSKSAKVRISGRDATLSELNERMPVRIRFDVDRKTIIAIWGALKK